MNHDPISLLHIEIRRRLREIDWIDTPYLQMLMDTKDEWLRYQEELKSIPHRIYKKELEPPVLKDGQLVFQWPQEPSDSQSLWEKMSRKKNS